MGQKPYFKATKAAETAPKVDFSDTTDGKWVGWKSTVNS
jgi:LemA protein